MLRIWLLTAYALLAVATLLGVIRAVLPGGGTRTDEDDRPRLDALARLCQLVAALAGLALSLWQAAHL